MKNILVVYYSQTGQTKEIAQNLVKPFQEKEQYNIDYYQIKPEKDYTFPWDGEDFYNAFPESFQQIPIAIKKPEEKILNTDYDLVILAYQIWYLTPSIPVNSFLKSEFAEKIFNNKKVITVISCRNMWAKAQVKMKTLLKNVNADLIGNIAFVDHAPNLISVITISHWLMGGKKDRKYGIFPKPGVAEEDIKNASTFGEIILQTWENNDFQNLQEKIIAAEGVYLKPFIIFMDEKANKMFHIWSKFVLKNEKNRKLKLKFFKLYLLTALFVISPLIFVIFFLTLPLRKKALRKKRLNYYSVN